MKPISLNDVISVATILRLPSYEHVVFTNETNPLEELKKLLSIPQVAATIKRRVPLRTYSELNVNEKYIVDLLMRTKGLGWLRPKLALYSAEVRDDIDKLERLIRDPQVVLPEALRKDVLTLIKKYRE